MNRELTDHPDNYPEKPKREKVVLDKDFLNTPDNHDTSKQDEASKREDRESLRSLGRWFKGRKS